MRKRDTQRARVYAWERKVTRELGVQMSTGFMSLEECGAFIARVWPKERGRYGLPRRKVPDLQRVHRGQTRAISHGGAVSLPRWARNPWVILHELAHELARTFDHGPRFTGVLIGLVSRWMGLDPDQLLVSAEEACVKVYRGSIGAVPHRTLPKKVLRQLPGTPVEIAVRLNMDQAIGVSYRQVIGAALSLVRSGAARWRGRRLLLALP